MRRAAQILVLLLAAAVLSGCAVDANATFFPKFMRATERVETREEPPPDVGKLLSSNVTMFFVPAAQPRNISYSAPVKSAREWRPCVQADVNGVDGRPIGRQTYLFSIADDRVVRSERVDPPHICFSETLRHL